MEIKVKYYGRFGGEIISVINTIEEIETNGRYLDQSTVIARCLGTGLKDKNGNEIFEGDITKDGWSDSIDEVTYDCGVFHLGYGYSDCIESQSEDSEIIGNKFQNPELLNRE